MTGDVGAWVCGEDAALRTTLLETEKEMRRFLSPRRSLSTKEEEAEEEEEEKEERAETESSRKGRGREGSREETGREAGALEVQPTRKERTLA